MKNIIKIYKEKILWGIFIFMAVLNIIGIDSFWGLSLINDPSFTSLFMFSLAVTWVALHAAWTLTYFRGAIFILLASLTGLIFEIIGMKYGSVFGGGRYVYQMNHQSTFFDVPLLIPLCWAGLIYTGYNIVSSFLVWINKDKPNKHRNDTVFLPLLILLDGLVVVAIDLILDPLQVKAGSWIWLKGGTYYDIPIQNFVDWFAVTVISMGIFRVFEYFSPQKPIRMDKSIFLMPVIGYGILGIVLLYSALKVQLPELALVGFFAIFPITVVNLMFFILWKTDFKGK